MAMIVVSSKALRMVRSISVSIVLQISSAKQLLKCKFNKNA